MDTLQGYFPNLSPEQQAQFAALPNLYAHWNAQINVISRKDMEHFTGHHVLHSLAIARIFQFDAGTRILDIGTGGGFPAVPLAILFPQVQFVACDSIAKKIKVVEAVCSEAGIRNITTYTGRAENIKGLYNGIVSRAVAPLGDLYGWTKHLLSEKMIPSYGWICLKGGDLDMEIGNLQKLSPRLKVDHYWLKDLFSEPFFETKQVLHVHF